VGSVHQLLAAALLVVTDNLVPSTFHPRAAAQVAMLLRVVRRLPAPVVRQATRVMVVMVVVIPKLQLQVWVVAVAVEHSVPVAPQLSLVGVVAQVSMVKVPMVLRVLEQVVEVEVVLAVLLEVALHRVRPVFMALVARAQVLVQVWHHLARVEQY
jgi:hypothetical protein